MTIFVLFKPIKTMIQKIKSLFPRYSQWLVIGTFNSEGKDMVVFARKNLRSGMIYFRSKRLTPAGHCSYLLRAIGLPDTSIALQQLIEIPLER